MGLFGRSDEIDYTKKEQKAIWSWLKWIDKYATLGTLSTETSEEATTE